MNELSCGGGGGGIGCLVCLFGVPVWSVPLVVVVFGVPVSSLAVLVAVFTKILIVYHSFIPCQSQSLDSRVIRVAFGQC